jgi:hypothetical protein
MRYAAGTRGKSVERRARRGHTLIEVTIAIGVLMVAVLAYSRSITGGLGSQRGLRERQIALNAARDMVESMRAQPFAELYQRYNSSDADDGALADPAPGPEFDVDGLDALPGAGSVGRIEFPEAEVAGAWQLREDLDRPEFGLPYSLDGDAAIDAGDKSLTYQLLPVRVVLEWAGTGGEQHLEVTTWIAD